MKPGRIVMLVLGTLAALMGLGLLSAAGAVGWVNFQQRDDGYFTTPTERYDVGTRAITTPGLNVMVDKELPDIFPVDSAGRVLLRGTAAAGRQIFIGIGPQADVTRYLTDVRHSELTDVDFSPFRAEYREIPGNAVPGKPGVQTFWSTSAQGEGTQQIEWDLRSGRWAMVVMNADAGTPVSVDLQAGVRSDLLLPVFVGLLISGIALLAVGVPLIVAGAAGIGRQGPPPHHPAAVPPQPYPVAGPPQVPAAAVPPPAPYPARLSGHLDPNLSRGMWLIKWFLAIPHLIVLFFLWFAFVVTTIVAGFAILFTGRYPRSLFNFNIGVLRWNWRVAFYAFTVIGTDRYPPFTLERTDYPADFDVDYPERLSHGLVLVKSWLLALPHLLIVALLTGTARSWGTRQGGWAGYQETGGISLVGLLVIIAGVILLFTGRYWTGLFDLLMGLNRWIYRVIAYVALMRDEYPPFRLDMGPMDPGDVPVNVPGNGPGGGTEGGPSAPAGPAAAASPPAAGIPFGPPSPIVPPDQAGPGGPARTG
jgi:hypothetical protein